MSKLTYLIFCIFSFYIGISQKDSASFSYLKQKKISHMLSAGAGLNSYYDMVGNKGDLNFSYLFEARGFMAKGNYAFTPGSNFGTVSKYFISFGYSSNINKKISWHLLLGGGLVGGDETYSKNGTDFYFGSLTPVLDLGMVINPFKDRDFLFSVNGTCFKTRTYSLVDPTYSRTIDNSYAVNVSLNFLYRFL